jgi:dTMP kinase
MAQGTLITLEGIDGAGKTTLAEAMRTTLRDRSITVELLREPGGVPTAEAIRALVHDPAGRIGARTEALLFAAARAQLVAERLIPLLQEGALVLLDRFVDSSLVYQGVGRSLGIDEIRTINGFATQGVSPDRTLLLELDPAEARARSIDRGGIGAIPDRMESEGDEFFERIAAAYRSLAAAEPGRIRVIDAGLPAEAVLRDALAAVEDLLA